MNNYMKAANTINWANDTGAPVVSGDAVPVGELGMGVAAVDIAVGGRGTVSISGVFRLAKEATTNALTQGKLVWLTGAVLTAMPSPGSYFIGFAEDSAAATTALGRVILAPFREEGGRQLQLAATGDDTITRPDMLSGLLLLICSNTETKTITLPSVAGVRHGALLFVSKPGGSSSAITIAAAPGEMIDGSPTYTKLNQAGERVTVQSDGEGWVLLGENIS